MFGIKNEVCSIYSPFTGTLKKYFYITIYGGNNLRYILVMLHYLKQIEIEIDQRDRLQDVHYTFHYINLSLTRKLKIIWLYQCLRTITAGIVFSVIERILNITYFLHITVCVWFLSIVYGISQQMLSSFPFKIVNKWRWNFDCDMPFPTELKFSILGSICTNLEEIE